MDEKSIRMRIHPVTSLLLVSLLALSSCDRGRKMQERKEALKEMADTTSRTVDSVQMKDGKISVDTESINRQIDSFDKAADKVGGKLGEAVKVSMEMAKENAAMIEKVEPWKARFTSVVDWRTLSAKRDYDARIQEIQEFKVINAKILEMSTTFESRLSARLDTIHMEKGEREKFQAGMMKTYSPMVPLLTEIRTADLAIADIMAGIIGKLKKIDSTWKWSDQQQCIEFKNPADMEEFYDEREKAAELIERQQRAQRKLVQVMQPH